MLKTSDAGSSFVDNLIFPYLPHVSRWHKEIGHLVETRDLKKLSDWWKHKPGEEVVGASVDSCYKLPERMSEMIELSKEQNMNAHTFAS